MPKAKDDINIRILDQLECPVCLETCTPPIFNCVNGHSFCSKCKENLQECGICRVPGKPATRCLILDNIANMVRVPCKNQPFGCKRKVALGELNAHEAECTFLGTAYCVLCVGWRGTTLKSFVGHLIAYHKGNVLPFVSSGIYEITTSIFKPGNENILEVIMPYNGTNFWLHLIYNPTTSLLICIMRLISKTSESHFQYTIEFKSKINSSSMIVTKVVSALKDFVPEANSKLFIPKDIIGYSCSGYSSEEVCFTITIKK